jgi:RNA polymerase sigma factor (TIGR02999 family)
VGDVWPLGHEGWTGRRRRHRSRRRELPDRSGPRRPHRPLIRRLPNELADHPGARTSGGHCPCARGQGPARDPTVRARSARHRTRGQPESYEAYLPSRFERNRRTPESLRAAVAHFTRALELDATWAPAHAALADCYNQFATLLVGTWSPNEYRPRAAGAAIRALQIDPFSAEAHATLGYVRHYDWQWDEAEREVRHAIELRSERGERTLNPTALVHELYVRLVDQNRASWQNPAQFFSIVARMMRRILVDHARARQAKKRGAARTLVSLDAALDVPDDSRITDILAIDEALGPLARIDPDQERIVELRFFAGLTVEETAHVLGRSPRTVKREWRLAKAWLFRELRTSTP